MGQRAVIKEIICGAKLGVIAMTLTRPGFRCLNAAACLTPAFALPIHPSSAVAEAAPERLHAGSPDEAPHPAKQASKQDERRCLCLQHPNPIGVPDLRLHC